MKARKFNVGDRVVLIEDHCSARKGMVGTIKYHEADFDYAIEFDNKFGGGHDCGGKCKKGYGHWVSPDKLELAPNKISVGSKVKSIASYRAGDIGTLEHYDKGDNTYKVRFEDGDWGWYREGEIELASTKPARIPVGSKVKIVKDTFHNKEFIGKTGTLKRDDRSKQPYLVIIDGDTSLNSDGWWFGEDELELLEPEPAAEPKPQTPSKPKIPTGEDLILASHILDNFKYIARDENGWLFAYTEKPIKDIGGTQWYSSSYYKELPKELFKFIKWGDLPTEIKNLKGGL